VSPGQHGLGAHHPAGSGSFGSSGELAQRPQQRLVRTDGSTIKVHCCFADSLSQLAAGFSDSVQTPHPATSSVFTCQFDDAKAMRIISSCSAEHTVDACRFGGCPSGRHVRRYWHSLTGTGCCVTRCSWAPTVGGGPPVKAGSHSRRQRRRCGVHGNATGEELSLAMCSLCGPPCDCQHGRCA
jgi:hypothetical protein